MNENEHLQKRVDTIETAMDDYAHNRAVYFPILEKAIGLISAAYPDYPKLQEYIDFQAKLKAESDFMAQVQRVIYYISSPYSRNFDEARNLIEKIKQRYPQSLYIAHLEGILKIESEADRNPRT